ncbi:MAG: hypothetical protein JW837_07870 [Sedimentisphaerales bacterium]|nr:hypothetical protein [Sedimentisphaerales bacterium]
MKKLKWLVVVMSVPAFSCPAVIADEELGFELTSDFAGKYVWRGQLLNDDIVFQPAFNITYGNLTAGLWGNLDLTNYNDRNGDFLEMDYSLDWSDELPGVEGIGYSVGLIYYDFPGSYANGARLPDTLEGYLGLNFDLPAGPSVTAYHDVDEVDGTYISLGFGHSVEEVMELSPGVPVAMGLSATIGWGSASYDKYYWGTNQSKINDLVLSVSFPFETEGLTITPSLNYVTLLSDDIREMDTYGTDSDFFFVGIGISKKF